MLAFLQLNFQNFLLGRAITATVTRKDPVSKHRSSKDQDVGLLPHWVKVLCEGGFYKQQAMNI